MPAMRNPILFAVVTAFFVTMNYLLWRSEFGEQGRRSSPVPVKSVLDKMLTAPDNSRLEIRHHGMKVGNCRWSASVGDDRATGKQMSEEPLEEGMIETISGYTLELDGNTSFDHQNRFRFGFVLKLSTNHSWQEFSVRLSLRPFAWEVRSVAADQTVQLHTEDDEGSRRQTFTFADLRQPDKILRELGDSFFPGAGLAALALPLRSGKPSALAAGLKWEAHNDWLLFGRNRMRVYRLQAKLLEGWQARVFISPVGEILRVELPDEILLVHEDLLAP